MRLKVSNGNTKLGQIPNTSFPPIITCRHNAPCAKDGCYALKFYKMYKSCKSAWDDNYEYYLEDPTSYWDDMFEATATTRYFRYFVSGDIPDSRYLVKMIALAKARPWVDFLCFTKQYEIVNSVLDIAESCSKAMTDEPQLPENLHLILSGWEGFTPENPHNLPTSEVITKGMEVPEDWKICGGNCTECACRGVGCWQIGAGETIAFYKH